MAFGITDAGFVLKTLETIKAEWEEAMRTAFGKGVLLSAESVFGQIVGIASLRESLLWEQLEAAYHALDPDSATGAGLDNIGAITAAPRLLPLKSAAALVCTGTPGTALDAGRVVVVTTSGARFVTDAAATIAAVSAWASSTAYALGALVHSGGRVYEATVAGTSSATAPTGTDLEANVVGGTTLRWRYRGQGTGAVRVASSSEDYGPIAAVANSIVTIDTSVAGWSSVCNPADADLGRGDQPDWEYRTHRENQIRSQGLAAVDAIRAAVTQVLGVTSCTVQENTTDLTDSAGRPPKSVEVFVEGGDAADLGAAIWRSKPSGIQAYGTSSVTVKDSMDVDRTVGYSRPADANIYIRVHGLVTDASFPGDGLAQIAAALATWADSYFTTGRNVVSSAMLPTIFAVGGVVECPLPFIGRAANPTSSSTVAIDLRERPRFDTTRISVSHTPA